MGENWKQIFIHGLLVEKPSHLKLYADRRPCGADEITGAQERILVLDLDTIYLVDSSINVNIVFFIFMKLSFI